VDVAVLGPLTVDGVATGLPRRDRVVLAALAVSAGDAVSAERLADALWGGDRPPASWVKVVQGCVVRLRRLLGPAAIETTPAGYRLAIPAETVDARRFERLVGRGRELLALGEPDRAAYLLGEALGLWRGGALAELEEWEPGRVEARRLEELRRDAEELRLEADLRAGRHREVLAAARAVVEEAPLRERRWALLVLAQYQSSRQADALHTLGEARSVLARELGLDPGPDLVALEEAVRRQDPALVAETALPEPRPTCPYPGLAPYDVADAEDFHGRDADIAACRSRLAEAGTVTVVGPSGSGKSSLIRAGLAAALRRDGRRVVVVTPGAHPLDALAALPGAGLTPVLVVDQCEEAALCADTAERTRFFAALTAHAERAPLLVAVRADRLGDLSAHPGFARLVERSLYLLNPMSPGDLRAAIEGPARGAGLRVEAGLVDLLVREVEGEPGALPLLSHALRATWERREGNTLTVAGYRDTGGVRGAVARSAEDVYQRVPPDVRPALRDLLLRLVAPNPEGDPMRSPVPRRLVAGAPHHEELIETLVAARLVTSDDGVVELAHEALARAWPRLRDWLDEDAEGQRILRHLVVAADTWDSMGRPDSELYRGVRLGQALQWLDRARPDLTPAERAFLAAARRLADAEEQTAAIQARRQKRVNRRLRGLLAGVVLLTIAALIAAALAADQRDQAVRQRNEAVALVLAGASRDAVDSNGALALALAAESSAATHTPLRQATDALIRARLAFSDSSGQPIREPLTGHTSGVSSMTFSPAGDRLASTGLAGMVLLWDPTTGGQVGDPLRHPGGVGAVVFSPDGNLLATAGFLGDDTVRLWDPATGDQVGEPLRHPGDDLVTVAFSPGGIGSGAFSPDGDLLATARYDGAVRLWDPATGKPLGKPLADPSTTDPNSADATAELSPAVAFSPDGGLLASAVTYGKVGAVLLWDPDTRRPVGKLTGLKRGVRAVAFSPDGDLLVTVAGDGTVRLWDPATHDPIRPLAGDTAAVGAVAFSPDATLLATSSGEDGTVRLWDPDTGDQVGEPLLHRSYVASMAFSPDGDLLATGGGSDGTVRVWDPDTGDPVGDPLTGPGYGIDAVAFSPDGRLLATANLLGAVRLWDPVSGEPVGEPLTPDAYAVTFSADGQYLLAITLFDAWLWRGLWDADEACALAASYLTIAQVRSYSTSGWEPVCRYAE
jgi:WD40 repeat protein/DNA-binding SARP family transcriptional activator